MRKEIEINFDKIRTTMNYNNEKYEFYRYVREMFEEIQDTANSQEISILGVLDNINNEGSYSYNIYTCLERLQDIYYSVSEFILDNKDNTGEDLSILYFTNVEAFEIYLLYDIYYKYIIDYDNNNEDEEEE